jgi:uncharacterized protein DUF3592
MAVLLIAGLGFAAVGAVFAGIGIASARSSRHFEESAARAPATVTDVRSRSVGRGTSGGIVWIPVVRFRTADGRTIDAEAGGGTNVKRWEPGQQVEVAYDPANPSDIRVPGSGGGLIQGLFMGIGILFAVLGVLLVAAAIAIGI